MTEQNNELGSSIPIPTYIVVLVIGAAFTGGAGLNSYLGPRVQESAIEQCTRQAATALDVAAQHGEEFVEVNRRIRVLRDYINEKSAERPTGEQQAQRWKNQEDINIRKERWLTEIERRLQAIERKLAGTEYGGS